VALLLLGYEYLNERGAEFMRQMIRLLACGLLVSGLMSIMFAQDDAKRDRQKNETTMTGCLNKDSSGGYTLTDEKTGTKVMVTGPSDLEKHSANHRVSLTGAEKTDTTGKTVFEVGKIQHLATSCKAPSQ
jgi:hypothetical protein